MILLKSKKQVEDIKKACKVVSETLDLLQNDIKAGITTKELDEIAEDFIRSKKAKPAFKGYKGYPASICTSINAEIVHGIPSKRKLKNNDIISIDVGVELNGYYGDAARTYAVSDKIPPEAKRLIEATKTALRLGIEKAKAGNRLFDISYAIQNYVERQGFSVVREFVGHGVGILLHEDPQIPNFGEPNTGIKLKPGMVLAIEPMVNLGSCEVEILDNGWTAVTKDRRLSAHFEDTIYIDENKTEVLT